MNQHNLTERMEALFGHDWSASSARRMRERVLESLRELTGRECVRAPAADSEPTHLFRDTELPPGPCDPEDYADLLDRVLRHSINVASPHSLGHMTGALPPFARVIGEVVIGLNQNLVKREASAALTMIERQTLAMLHRLVFRCEEDFYSRHTQAHGYAPGVMTSCGTLANLTALWCARNACFPPHAGAPAVEEHGLAEVLRFHGYERAVILGSELMHYSVEKAAGVLGLGARGVIKLPVDEHNRLSVPALKEAVADCERRRWRVLAIVAVAGTTECGSVDPLAEVAAVAAAHGIHLHVDAAWGGPLLFSARHRGRLEGIALADSVTIDAHKQLYVPVGVSAVLLRDPRLAKAVEMQASYILRDGSGDLGRVSVEGSRPGTALFLHAALHLFGLEGYEFLIDENIAKTRLMASLISALPEFELLARPQTNIVLYRYLPERWRGRPSPPALSRRDNDEISAFNVELQQAQYEAGRTYVSRTTLATLCDYRDTPVACLRAVIANPLVREYHLRAVLEDQAGIAVELERAAVATGS